MRWLRVPRVVGVVVGAYLVLVTGYFASELTRRTQFIADSATTTGTVIALEPRPLPGTTRVHTIGDEVPRAPEVRYEVSGRSYTYTPTHGLIGSPVQVGEQIEVLYDPQNPALARLRNEEQLLLPIITAGFATTTIALIVVLVLTRNRGGPRVRSQPTNAGPGPDPEPARS